MYKIHKVPEDFIIPEINKHFINILKTNPEMLNNLNNNLNFGFKKNNKLQLFIYDKTNEFCLVYESDLSKNYVNFLNDFIPQIKLNLKTGYNLLLIAKELNLDEIDFFNVLKFCKWPSSKKGMDYFNSFNKCTDILKNMYFNKKLSLKETILFQNYFKSNYDDLLKIIPEKLSYSQRSDLIRNIVEYSCKNNLCLNDILKLLTKEPPDNLLEKSFTLRYPIVTKYTEKFQDYLKKFNFKGDMHLEYDKTFEKQDYLLNIKFNNLDTLRIKVDKLKKSIEKFYEKYGEYDLFDHENLFS